MMPLRAAHSRDRIVWLGRLDSNQGMAESKSAALPLGYAPIRPRRCRRERGRTIQTPLKRINGGSKFVGGALQNFGKTRRD